MVDEGHRLKNMNCKLLKEMKFYSCQNKVLLTGTPLQNNLNELWSLLHFLMPSKLIEFMPRKLIKYLIKVHNQI